MKNNVDDSFRARRALEYVGKMTTEELKANINFGLQEVKRLASRKSPGWFEEFETTEKVMRLCDEELKRRGEGTP